jgi:hypothetical protein
MTSLSLLAELHVREFVSRQKHRDKLNDEDCIHHPERCGKARTQPEGDWRRYAIACAGPLCLLDAVGQAEESWVELFEHAPRCDLPEAKFKSKVRPTLHRSFDGQLHEDADLRFA